MVNLPAALSIAMWLVLSLWAVGMIAYVFDLPGEYVWIAFIVGVAAAFFEWHVHTARARSQNDE